MTKPKLPSEAQAKKLARYWSSRDEIHISDSYVEPTDAVLIRNGWITPTGAAGIFPQSRMEFLVYQLSAAGFAALGEYFFSRR